MEKRNIFLFPPCQTYTRFLIMTWQLKNEFFRLFYSVFRIRFILDCRIRSYKKPTKFIEKIENYKALIFFVPLIYIRTLENYRFIR